MNETSFLERLAKRTVNIPYLKDLGLEDLAPTPTIIVCGDRQSGKASVIEKLIGYELIPKGTVKQSILIVGHYRPETSRAPFQPYNVWTVFSNCVIFAEA